MGFLHLSEWFGDPKLISRLNKMLEELYDAYSPKAKTTSLGGFAVKLTNRTGATSVKGLLVKASTAYDAAVQTSIIQQPDPIGAFLESGVPNGSEAWVVVSGVAEVLFVGSTTRGNFARVCWAADAGAADGQAVSEAVPTSPFATDKHFGEIGHVLQSRTGAGLALVNLHWN